MRNWMGLLMPGSGTALLFLCTCLATWMVPPLLAGDKGAVREPAVAGQFYPGEKAKLEAAVKAYLADALPARGEKPIALVVPHAGYVFSGQMAADAFKQAAGYPYDVVVVLGTNHTVAPFDGVSLYQGAGIRTPLGVVPVDQELVKALSADPSVTPKPQAHVKEHSEEVQLPFVQVLFPSAKVVTGIVGRPDYALASRFGQALAKALKGRSALVVASSDLSHYPAYGDAVEVDRKTLRAVASLDATAVPAATSAAMTSGRPELTTCACGEGAIMAAMVAARALGASRGVVVSYANSGDTVFGEYDRVVGYGAVVFTAGAGGPDTKALEPEPAPAKAPSLTDADKGYLLGLARSTIQRYLTTGTVPFPRTNSPALRFEQGAFVTLNEHGNLRGCIGSMQGNTPLALTVARMALEAALHDTRFSPVRDSEVQALEIEISALTPFQKVPGAGSIQVGRDGVVIRKSGRSAVFLPQVAPEQGWSRDEMLDHLCEKAGLPGDCWHSGTEFYTFQAIVFSEKKK